MWKSFVNNNIFQEFGLNDNHRVLTSFSRWLKESKRKKLWQGSRQEISAALAAWSLQQVLWPEPGVGMWGRWTGGETGSLILFWFSILPYSSPICVNFHVCKALGYQRTPFLVPVPLPFSLLNLILFALLSGCYSNYHMIICFHDFSKILLALKSLPVSRNCLILRKVVSQDWNRKKEKILTDQSQALKLKLWFKNSQQTKVQDLMTSQANSIKHLGKS